MAVLPPTAAKERAVAGRGSQKASVVPIFLLFQNFLMKQQELLLGYSVRTCTACETRFPFQLAADFLLSQARMPATFSDRPLMT